MDSSWNREIVRLISYIPKGSSYRLNRREEEVPMLYREVSLVEKESKLLSYRVDN